MNDVSARRFCNLVPYDECLLNHRLPFCHPKAPANAISWPLQQAQHLATIDYFVPRRNHPAHRSAKWARLHRHSSVECVRYNIQRLHENAAPNPTEPHAEPIVQYNHSLE